MSGRSVEVKIELGHKAVLKDEPTDDGYTHDWTVFVKGPEGCRIENFVEKVIFQLHESFPKSRRTIREPPYQVSESGYAGFNMPVWVYFKTKEDPKKIEFIYDLYLSLDGKPINNIRCEKLTFHNPPDDFCQKLLKGGGSFKVQSSSPGKKPPTPPEKKSPQQLAALPPVSKPFSDLFGAPIIKGVDAKAASNTTPNAEVKKEKKRDKRDNKDHKKEKKKDDAKRDASGKDVRNTEKPLKEKVKTELPPPSEPIRKEERSSKDDRKRPEASPPERSGKVSPSDDKDPKRKKKKSSSHKDSPDPKRQRLDDTLSNKAKKKSQSKESLTSPLSADLDDVELSFTPSPTPSVDQRKKKSSTSPPVPERKDVRPPLPPPPKPQPLKKSASPADIKKKPKPTPTGALATMMMELDGEQSSPEQHEHNDLRKDKLSVLRVKIMKLNDDKLQQVVDIIEATGKFELSNDSFDFDLCKIDGPTISRIQQLVS